MTRRTPLHAAHLKLGARMVEFAGWDMPVMYSGILPEARAVRGAAGVFDISHMGRIRISGAGATDLLQSVTSNDCGALSFAQAQYSLLTNAQGGIIDDIIVYREASESYLVVINAGNTDKDIAWIRSRAGHADLLDNRTESTAMIAVQGPRAAALISDLCRDSSLLNVRRFHYARGSVLGANATLCRTGYTGEDGFEVITGADAAEAVWDAVIGAGATPCGLGARDALRIEAGYPLYGHEIDDTTSPVEAGLMWVVKLDKGDFTGRDVIQRARDAGPARKLVGLVCEERTAPRQGYTIWDGATQVGEITSGVFSPTLNHSVAMAYLATPYARSNARVEVDVRGRRVAATVVPKKRLLPDHA